MCCPAFPLQCWGPCKQRSASLQTFQLSCLSQCCCHWQDWCVCCLFLRHYCQVSMTQDKRAGIYLWHQKTLLMWGPQDVLEMWCRDTVILHKLSLSPTGITSSGSAATLLDLDCFPTGPLMWLHIPSTMGLGGFINLGTVPDMSCLSASI